MLENQATYLEGKESDLFSMLLRVRYCNEINASYPIFAIGDSFFIVLQGTNAIRDALTSKLEPVYGLTTMHASLRSFYAEPPPTESQEDIKAATYAFGLIALGKFIVRLPAEIAEEELPRLKMTLISVRCLLLSRRCDLFD
jgi:CLIP-associating protein 1/2